jgi:hypothetical protein
MGMRPDILECERNETTSSADEHPVNEDMDMDDLLKNWKAKKKTKRNS